MSYREPVELQQVDPFSCYTNVIAQARWMLGASDRCDAAAVREVDRLTGRRPGRPAGVQSQLLLLACEGCHLISFEASLDLDRLRTDSAAYMRELVGDRRWNPEYEAHWTPERCAHYARKVEIYQRRFRRQFEPFTATGQVRVVAGKVHLRHLDRLLDAGYVIAASVEGSATAAHAILIHGRTRIDDHAHGDYAVYEPNSTGDETLDVWCRHYLDRFLLKDNGVVALKRRPAATELKAVA